MPSSRSWKDSSAPDLADLEQARSKRSEVLASLTAESNSHAQNLEP